MTDKPKTPRALNGEAQPQTYVVLVPRVIVNRQWEAVKGDIVDLSHLPPESIRAFVAMGWYATASGEPINKPAADVTVQPCRNCEKE